MNKGNIFKAAAQAACFFKKFPHEEAKMGQKVGQGL